MFTGLIQDVGEVIAITRQPVYELQLSTRLGAEKFMLGESIAVNGACLTVTRRDADGFCLQLSPETLSRTNLGELRVGTKVNLERAMMLGDRLGGHLVLGHIDGVTKISKAETVNDFYNLTLELPPPFVHLLIEKGSVTLDGVSLTVNSLSDLHFEVTLIPETQHRTILGAKGQGDSVNLECDMIGKYVERLRHAR